MGKLRVILGLASWLVVATPATPQLPHEGKIQMPTADRVMDQAWWPTKGGAARDEYVGSAACAGCHKEKARSQATTPMAHAASPAADSEFLTARQQLDFHTGPYRYAIARASQGVSYSVSNGTESISVPLLWAFGGGETGQTYVYEQDGAFYESRLSYYTKPEALDFTAGHPRSAPPRLDQALGQRQDPSAARACFGCHTTASTTNNRFDPNRLMPGVTCEACHGPGSRHVAAMNLDPEAQGPKYILNPASLSPIDSVEFCGACHRARWDVELSRATGLLNVRFQAYRLETSRCFGKPDSRITCIACHDPHVPLVRETASYDKICLSCHVTKTKLRSTPDHTGASCPVKEKDCVTCHMPKIEVPSMHTTFTDHRIRIAQTGKPFPD